MDQQVSPSQPVAIAPEEKIEIVLQAQQWNGVLMALTKQPYEFSAPLIEAIRAQCVARAETG